MQHSLTLLRIIAMMGNTNLFLSIFCFLHLSTVNAGTFYYRTKINKNIEKSSIISRVSGISEKSCLLRCRRSSECKHSVYESSDDKNSQCLLLKNVTLSGGSDESLTTLHVEIPITGKSFCATIGIVVYQTRFY